MSISNLLRSNNYHLDISATELNVGTGGIVSSGIISADSDLNIKGTLRVDSASTFTNALIVTDTVDSVSFTTGAVVVSGGVSIAKSLYINSLTMAQTDTFPNNPIFLEITAQNLGTVTVTVSLLSNTSYAIISLPSFTTSSMATNGTFIVTNSGVVAQKYRPLHDVVMPITTIVNGAYTPGTFRLATDGQIYIYANFTAGQTNGFAKITLLYNLY